MTNRGRYVLIAVVALPAVFVAASRMRADVVRALTTSAEPEAFGLVLSGTEQAIASALGGAFAGLARPKSTLPNFAIGLVASVGRKL